ncbi:MAG: ATP-binding protein [Candidatus Omnitrophica bacterium]|nr:ATP-binding protein [Candidatus Omnitrophota bacterium]
METCELPLDEKTRDISKSLLCATLKEMLQALGCRCGSLYLFDPETGALAVQYSYSPWPGLAAERSSLSYQDDPAAMLNLRKPVVIKGGARHRHRSRRAGPPAGEPNASLCLPLFVEGGFFGVAVVGDPKDRDGFTERDFSFAKALAAYACGIIEQLRNASKIRKEKELLTKEKSLLEQYAAVGKLAAGIVHQITNPLDGAIRFANILIRHVEPHSVVREYVSEIKNGLHRIESITRSLLTFGCQFNTSTEAAVKLADVPALLEEALDVFAGRIACANVTIVKRFCRGRMQVADRGLQQVFINIIKNALDAMPRGGTLFIETRCDRSSAEIVFRDTGCGIAPQAIGHIFEPFFTTKGPAEGAGLGLSISREIVEACRGTIAVESIPDSGAAFVVRLPVHA